MPQPLFWFFTALMLIGGIAVITFRNPVSAAMAMVASFVGLAGLFISLDAFFVGVMQIMVYAGAIMVLFVFIIMLLDLKSEEKRTPKYAPILGGVAVISGFVIQLIGVLSKSPDEKLAPLDLKAASAAYQSSAPSLAAKLGDGQHLPDVNLIGDTLFKHFNFPLQVVGVLLLVATIGVVVLSKSQTQSR